jgi:hypothetical protein
METVPVPIHFSSDLIYIFSEAEIVYPVYSMLSDIYLSSIYQNEGGGGVGN